MANRTDEPAKNHSSMSSRSHVPVPESSPEDVDPCQYSPTAPSNQPARASTEPNYQKFSRYRSIRKSDSQTTSESGHGQQSIDPEADEKNQVLKQSMSRYKTTRPLQPPGTARKANSSGQAAAEHATKLTDEHIHSSTNPPEKTKRLPAEYRLDTQSQGYDYRTGHSPVQSPQTISPPSASTRDRAHADSRSPHSPHSGRSQHSDDGPVRGLIAYAQNSDPSLAAVAASGPQHRSKHGFAGSAGRSESGRSGLVRHAKQPAAAAESRPLVDLATQSTFVKGSLLAGVEQREERLRSEQRAKLEAWKARRT